MFIMKLQSLLFEISILNGYFLANNIFCRNILYKNNAKKEMFI